MARILLDRDIQAKILTAQGIHDAMEIIRRGQQESAAAFRLMEQLAQNMLVNPGAESPNLGNTPANSLASTMPPPWEDQSHNPCTEAGS